MGKIRESASGRTVVTLFGEAAVTGLWAYVDAEFLEKNAFYFVFVGIAGLLISWFWDEISDFRKWKKGFGEKPSLSVELMTSDDGNNYLYLIRNISEFDAKIYGRYVPDETQSVFEGEAFLAKGQSVTVQKPLAEKRPTNTAIYVSYGSLRGGEIETLRSIFYTSGDFKGSIFPNENQIVSGNSIPDLIKDNFLRSMDRQSGTFYSIFNETENGEPNTIEWRSRNGSVNYNPALQTVFFSRHFNDMSHQISLPVNVANNGFHYLLVSWDDKTEAMRLEVDDNASVNFRKVPRGSDEKSN